jgi:hypothetical protein
LGLSQISPVLRGADIVAHGGGEIERRDPMGCADLDDPPRIAGAAELIAELRLVAVERDQLVGAKSLDLILRGRMRALRQRI